jgi:hypothetical protein
MRLRSRLKPKSDDALVRIDVADHRSQSLELSLREETRDVGQRWIERCSPKTD